MDKRRLSVLVSQLSNETMSGVTLDELLKEVGISPTQLNKPCTSEHLQDIALFLESWRTVALHLGLFKVQVEDIERETEKEKEKKAGIS